MLNWEDHDFCSECYTVEKSIEVVVEIKGKAERIRIDALRDERRHHYSPETYIQETITVQPSYPQIRGSFDSKPKEVTIWVEIDLKYRPPRETQPTADDALNIALIFLRANLAKEKRK